MRAKRSVFLALVASVAFTHAAAAADLGGAPRRPINDEPLPYGPAFSWTGLYIGAHVGYGWSDADWQFDATPGISTNHSGSGALAGGQIGYNLQVRQFVFGAEADLSSAWLDGATACPDPGLQLRPQLQLDGLRARPRRRCRERQSHAALWDGRRRLGRRRLCGQGRRHRRHVRHRVLEHARRLGGRRRRRAHADAEPHSQGRVSLLRLRLGDGTGRRARRRLPPPSISTPRPSGSASTSSSELPLPAMDRQLAMARAVPRHARRPRPEPVEGLAEDTSSWSDSVLPPGRRTGVLIRAPADRGRLQGAAGIPECAARPRPGAAHGAFALVLRAG